MTETTTIDPTTDPRTLALLRNDLRGLSKDDIGQLVAELTRRMGVDPSLAPIDLIPDRGGALRLYINARGAAELAKRHELNDEALDVDVRDRVVIVKVAKTDATGRVLRDVGAASFDPDKPDTLARAVKMATTSAHRRATLRMVGIFLNEPESWSNAGVLPDA
jgi:hypothetical protein